MKKILLTLLIVISANTYSQSNYDMRKIRWGMSFEEVINSEKPLIYSEKNKNTLIYRDVWVGDYPNYAFYATLEYEFKNNKVISLTYDVSIKNERNNSPVNKTFSLSKKIFMIDYVFDALEEKGFKCTYGWSNLNFKEKCDHSLSPKTVKKVEQLAKQYNNIRVEYSMESSRSFANFTFFEFENSETTKSWSKNGLLYSLKISAEYEIEKELFKNKF